MTKRTQVGSATDARSFLATHASQELVLAIRGAIDAAETDQRPVVLADIVDQLLDDETVRSRLDEPVRLKGKAAMARRRAETTPANDRAGQFGFDLTELIGPAIELAGQWGAHRVTPPVLLATCIATQQIRESSSVATQEALRAAGLTVERLLATDTAQRARRVDFTFKSLGFGTDLTAMARAGYWPSCPLVGMDEELKRLTCLASSGADSVVLVGEPGVGKSSIVYGLAYHIAHQTRPLIPPEMDNWTLVMIAPVNLLAGTGGRGELEDRLEKMLAFFRKNPSVIPFFDEIHTLLDTEDATSRAVATALKPPMAAGQFRCLGASTDKEYARFIANDEAMNSRFTRLLLAEPDHDLAAQILEMNLDHIVPRNARDAGIDVGPDAIDTVVRLTAKYQRNDRLPRKAIRLLRTVATEAAYAVRVGGAAPGPITPQQVAETFSGMSGIPVDDLIADRAEFYQNLSQRLGERVRGQAQAIGGVTSWLSLHASGWVDSRRPRGCFLFLGPPGVGKTELAVTIAEQVMRDRGSLIVKNMAEFKGEGARSKFMGADPGYVGFGQVSTVYSAVMMRPYSVVVLDEFEKAHPDLADPLLSVLAGGGEDSQGRWVDFSQCIFVLTSNAIYQSLPPETDEDALRQALLSHGGIFQPPLVDRIDRVVMFNPLSDAIMHEILDGKVEARRSSAAKPLPPAIDQPQTRDQIVAWARQADGGGSARGLERALLRWLMLTVESNDTVNRSTTRSTHA